MKEMKLCHVLLVVISGVLTLKPFNMESKIAQILSSITSIKMSNYLHLSVLIYWPHNRRMARMD